MYTPLEIESKKFAKQMMNGYSVEEVDKFLDELTVDYEKLYVSFNENNSKIGELESSIVKYKGLESTLNNTLIMAQSTADEIRKVAGQQAEQIIKDAQATAREEYFELEKQIAAKEKELEELDQGFEAYKSQAESLLIAQLEVIKQANKKD